MPSSLLSRIALLAPILLLAARAQDAPTQPSALPSADKRAIPATPAEGRRLMGLLESERGALEQEQRESPVSGRARTIQLLEEQVETIKRLDARKQEHAAEITRLARTETGLAEIRKRMAQVGQDEEALPDPADPNAEVAIARDRETTEDLIREEQQRREEAAAAHEKLKLEQERALRRVPMAKRDLNEAQADLADYETDSREAVSGGLAGEHARMMLEQVFLYRLRVAEHQATLDGLRYQAGELGDMLIDETSLEVAFADEKLGRLDARRRKLSLLAEKAAESRLERGRSERDLMAKIASEVPAWARPYWELKQKLAAINFDVADVGRKKRGAEIMIGPGGEAASLHAEAAAETRSFAQIDAHNAGLELEDVVPATTTGLLQFIQRREAELDRVQELQDHVRGMRKDLRERHRASRAQDAVALASETESARRTTAAPEGADLSDPNVSEAANPAAWDKLASALKAGLSDRARLLDEYEALLDKASKNLAQTRDFREHNLIRYRSALLWTRDPSEISVDSLSQARSDMAKLPNAVGEGVSAAVAAPLAWTRNQAGAGRFGSLLAVFGSLLAVVAVGWFVHRRSTALGSVVRQVEWTGLIAFAGVVLPAIAGASRETVAICAAVFTPPFFYQLARALIGLLFGGKEGARGILGLPEAWARLLRTTCVLILRICACFVPLAVLLTVTGYREHNPGVVELLWLLNAIGCFLVVLGVLLRPSGLPALVRSRGSKSGRAAFLKTALAAAYPAVIAAVIFLLVLRSLSYRVAVQYFLERFLISAGWIAAAIVLRRWFARILFGGAPPVPTPPHDLAADRERYEAEGRRALLDRLRRLAITLATFGPATFFVLAAWGLTGAGWDAVFNRPLTFISDTLTLGDIVSAVVTAVLAFFVVRSARDLLRFVILPRTSLDVGVRYTIVTLTTYVLVAISAVVILGGQLKVEPAVIGGFVAALGLGLGFGLQEIINNFFSGLILLVERPLKVGDVVSVSGTVGRVDRINMRSTTIMTGDNMGVIVPNKDLISSTVTNWSAGTPTIRVTIPLSISYGSDTALFKQVVGDVVNGHGLVMKSPPPDLSFTGFGASSLDFQLQYWIRLSSPGGRIKSDLYFALDAAFRKHGIEMPYPTQDLHVRSWPPPEGREAGFGADGHAAAGREAKVAEED